MKRRHKTNRQKMAELKTWGVNVSTDLKQSEKAFNYFRAALDYMEPMSPAQLQHLRKMCEGHPRAERHQYQEDLFDLLIEVCTVEAVRRMIVDKAK